MAQTLQHRRTTTSALAPQVGTAGEIFMDETKKTLVVMDGITAGGFPMAKESDLPTALSELTNDAGFVTENYVTSTLVFSGDYADLTNTPTLFSGAYADLTGKPNLGVYQLASTAFSGAYADLTGAPNLSTYQLTVDAFTGNYNDLANKPTLFTGAYSPAVPSNWNGTAPTTIAAALDRLAVVVKALNGGTGA